MVKPDIRLRAHGEAALRGLERLQGDASIEVTKNLEQVMRHLVEMRNELIEAHRTGHVCDGWLASTNAILSSLFGTEFPNSGLQWRRVGETREALRNLLRSI